MPSPIMFTEAAFMYGPPFATPRERRQRVEREFDTFARMRGIDVNRLNPAVLHEAREICGRCACRRACRRWLRTGVFTHPGDQRCPNAALLHDQA